MLRRPFPCQQLDVRLWDGDARSHLTLLLLISSKLLLQVHETLIQLSDLVCQEITLAPWRQGPQCDLFSSQRTNGYTWVLPWSRRHRKKKELTHLQSCTEFCAMHMQCMHASESDSHCGKWSLRNLWATHRINHGFCTYHRSTGISGVSCTIKEHDLPSGLVQFQNP